MSQVHPVVDDNASSVPKVVVKSGEVALEGPWVESSPLTASADNGRPTLARRVRAELRKPGAYLLPLRLFIGVGWLRACAEKLVDSGWRDGTSVQHFLSGHLDAGQVAFPFYQSLIHQLFLPNAEALGWIITIGQALVGLALLTGTLTNAALLGGLFMNLNFLLSGNPDPSAFYIVIQASLLLANAGAVLGVDAHLSQLLHGRHPLFAALVAGLRSHMHLPSQRRFFVGTGLVSLPLVGYALAYAKDFSPGGSVKDPAMVLVVLAMMGLACSVIGYVQWRPRRSTQPARIWTLPNSEVVLNDADPLGGLEAVDSGDSDLAASEASRWALSERVQRLARQGHGRRARWLWVSGGMGAIVGAVALSLALGMAGSRQVRATPAMLPLVVPAPAAAVASPGAQAEWPAVLNELDVSWEQDWPATITRLERFLDRWPGYPAAEDKLYTALVADAEDNLQAEQVSAGVAELERAARLLPERSEGWARLAQLATAASSEHP